MAKEPLQVRAGEDLKNKIKYIAKIKKYDYADYVRYLLMADVEKFEDKHGTIDDVLINQIKMEV